MRRLFHELSALAPGSFLLGFVIGFAMIGASFWYWSPESVRPESRDLLWLAIWGGGAGAMLMLPAGPIVFYGIFKRTITLKETLSVVLLVLFSGCLVGISLGIYISPILLPISIPFLIAGASVVVVDRRSRYKAKSAH